MQLVFSAPSPQRPDDRRRTTCSRTRTWTQPSPNDVNVIERFDADFDIRHRFVFSANYELPFGQSRTGAAKQLLAGWQINSVAYCSPGCRSTSPTRPRAPTRAPPTIGRTWSAIRRSSNPTVDAVVQRRRRSRRSRSTRSATRLATRCTVRRSGASTCRCSRTSSLTASTTPAAANRVLQPHEHAELREPERGARRGRVRIGHEHRQLDSAADAVCGEAAVLEATDGRSARTAERCYGRPAYRIAGCE